MTEKPFCILVVQSEKPQARRIHQMLFDLGHESEVLASGNEAFERIRGGGPLDLLVTELALPGHDGLALITELRKRWTQKQCAVVVITAFPGLVPQIQRAGYALGVDAVLMSKAPALETSAAFTRALAGKKPNSVALAPPSKEAFGRSSQAALPSLSRRIATIHLAVDRPQDEALEKIVQEVAEAFQVCGARVVLNQDQGGASALYWNGKDATPPTASDETWSFMAPRSDQGHLKPLIVADARRSVTLKSQPLIKAGIVGAFASFPLTAQDDKNLGFISIFDAKERPLTAEENDHLGALVKRLGREIAANGILHEMRQSMAAQWQVAMDRESRMEMMRGVLEALHLGVLLHDAEGKIHFVNSRLAEISGVDARALRRLDVDAFHGLFQELLEEPRAYKTVLPSFGQGPYHLDHLVETKRPRRQVLRWTAMPLTGDSQGLQLNLWEEITAEVDLQAQRSALVSLDGLTELLNRRADEEELQREEARAKRNKRPYAVLRLYVHDLKAINRAHGLDEGDLVLQAIGVCLRKCLRLPDRAARWSGSHFLVILPETSETEAHKVASRIRDAVGALDLGFPVVVSIGVGGSVERSAGTRSGFDRLRSL